MDSILSFISEVPNNHSLTLETNNYVGFVLVCILISVVYFMFGCCGRKLIISSTTDDCLDDDQMILARCFFNICVDLPFICCLCFLFNFFFCICFLVWKAARYNQLPDNIQGMQSYFMAAFIQLLVFAFLSIPFGIFLIIVFVILLILLFYSCSERSCDACGETCSSLREGWGDLYTCQFAQDYFEGCSYLVGCCEGINDADCWDTCGDTCVRFCGVICFHARNVCSFCVQCATCFRKAVRQQRLSELDTKFEKYVVIEKASITCPITQCIFNDPVMVKESGSTYEKTAIQTWFKKHDTDPLTNKKLYNKKLVQNRSVKSIVDDALAFTTEKNMTLQLKKDLEESKKKNGGRSPMSASGRPNAKDYQSIDDSGSDDFVDLFI